MSTRFSIRRREPRMVPEYDEVEVACTSGGWRPLFFASKVYGIGSVRDLLRVVESGEVEVVDEYGRTYTPHEFVERVVEWKGGRFGARSHVTNGGSVYVDGDGYEFYDWEGEDG